MEYYAQVQAATTFPVEAPEDPSQQWQHAVVSPSGDTGLEAVWHLSLQSGDEMEDPHGGPYPERPGEPDCVYYMRTGMCSFGISCRYNHPPNWKLAAAMARSKGEYPERPGQPECQYFMKTGTCKFGSTCKYHHPRDKAGQAGRVQLNLLGLPMRQGEKECAYYMRTGACKYGVTCKYHHPQPTPVMPGSPQYSSTSAGQQPYPWSLRPPYLHSPRPGPTGYPPMVVPPPQGIVSMSPGWTTYQGPVSPLASPEGTQHLGLIYSPHGDPSFNPMGLPSLPASPLRDASVFFPERPGMPDCQYYLKTGDCKFGAACRYHHPKDKAAGFSLSVHGLPMRPGAPPCTYYSRYGQCKFGSACRYDHPLGSLTYSPSTSSLADMPVAPYPPTPTQVSVEVSRTQHSSSASEELGRSGSEELTSGSHVQSSVCQVD